MADETIKALAVQVALDDGSFSAGMKSLQRNLSVIDSEFKASVAGVKNWGTNLDALKGNAQVLGDKINVQKQVMQSYSDQLNKSRDALSQNSQKNAR
jgi:phage-related minor tail protein